jgi:hypothetical protein
MALKFVILSAAKDLAFTPSIPHSFFAKTGACNP